ncbi:MAG: 50S ribosome-binding GTPase [Campylobacterales bacterium]|nr:50S ribosome-binding GTPase [Campylobacterales bacterium]
MRKDLIEIIAHSEVSIDYAEEDLPDDILNGIKSKIDNINKILSKTLSASLKRDGLLNGYKVAIIGKPNAGKSSLLNRLLSYERAIVSDIAGTTRDSVEAELYIADHLVKIIDTAGIREGIEVIERIGIERSKEIAKEADLVLGVFDGSLDFDSDDEQILKILSESEGIEKIVVINKEDLKRKLFHEKLNSFQQVSISTKDTIEPLLRKIEKILDSHDSFEEHMLVSKRQRDIVVKTIEELNIAVEIVQEGSLELFSYHIQNSVQYITEITKPYDYSEVMDVMFGDFCLGK